MMLVLGAWRDGRAGLAWCTLQAGYEYLIVLKVEEIKHPEYLTGEQPVAETDPVACPQTTNEEDLGHLPLMELG